MKRITLHPNAKINLGLFILGRREDGFHLLETLMYPVDVKDELEIMEADAFGIDCEGIEIDADAENNLVSKAFRALKDAVEGVPDVRIRLKKNIPAGAGLGGGSADAAFFLKGMNELFELGLADEELAGIAAKLGSDVPFFIFNRPMIARGTGTELEAVDIRLPFRIELITPGIHSDTAKAYKAVNPDDFHPERNLKEVLKLPYHQWKGELVNDLEKPVFRMHPELKRIKEDLYAKGAVYAAMTGSGSGVFGLFEDGI